MSSSPAPGVLTRDRILAAAEEAVRRHGPSKATVVDVAQLLGVSHGSIYRFFPTKTALREAVVTAWLHRVGMVRGDELGLPPQTPAADRLKAWFQLLTEKKRVQRARDPELFEAFRQLCAETKTSVRAYLDDLTDEIAAFLAAGAATGELAVSDPAAEAWALLVATTRFHHPAFAAEWDEPGAAASFETLWAVLTRGILSGRSRP